MSSPYFAHSRPGRPESDWEPLETHLRLVSEGAAGFVAGEERTGQCQ